MRAPRLFGLAGVFLAVVPTDLLAETECHPTPLFLNVDYRGSPGDAFVYLSPDRDQPLHLWGRTEAMSAFSEIDQHITNAGGINHRLPGVSIEITPESRCGTSDCYTLPAVRISPDPRYPAACIYGPLAAPTPATTLTMPVPTTCQPQRTSTVNGRRVYKGATLRACKGEMRYALPDEPEQQIDIGTLGVRFSDGYMAYRNYFLPGALSVFKASIRGGQIVGGGITFADLLNSTGGYIYSVAIDMPNQHERVER